MNWGPKLERFIEAFDCHVGTCSRACDCGRIFYNPDGDWDFEKGEIESLEANPTATSVDYTVVMLEFEGTIYIQDCDCWHKRAEQIMRFLDRHSQQIAAYLNGEKEAATANAAAMPTVGKPAPAAEQAAVTEPACECLVWRDCKDKYNGCRGNPHSPDCTSPALPGKPSAPAEQADSELCTLLDCRLRLRMGAVAESCIIQDCKVRCKPSAPAEKGGGK